MPKLRSTTHVLLAGLAFGVGLAGSAVLIGTPVYAQLAIEPQSLSVSVPQDETVTQTATLTNTGSEPLTFCLNFDRPLQRMGGTKRLAEGTAGGAACGPYGEVLYRLGEDDVDEGGWSPTGITMTPEGRLFTSAGSGLHRTFELTPDLHLVRSFEHPHLAELAPFAAVTGVTYDAANGTLWWMNIEQQNVGGQDHTRRVLFLEGDLDGVATGRRAEIVSPEDGVGDYIGYGPSYDPATDRFYFTAVLGPRVSVEVWKVWAVDREGAVVEGYPLRPEPYPEGIFNGLTAHGGAEGVRFEYGAYPPNAPGYDRIVVVDRWGRSEGEALETPVPPSLFEPGGAGVRGTAFRSRTDPNGVLYMAYANFDDLGIVGVRPHPLPPSWLVVGSDAGPEGAWDGTLAPDESRELTLTFRAGARAVGSYTSALQAFDAATGEAVEVPLTLAVTQGTVSEEEAADVPEASSLSVYPNPFSREATVALTLDAASEVRVSVYDVLGRRVAVLAEGYREAGTHRFRLDGAGLPAGVYLVRGEVGGQRLSDRVTVVR